MQIKRNRVNAIVGKGLRLTPQGPSIECHDGKVSRMSPVIVSKESLTETPSPEPGVKSRTVKTREDVERPQTGESM